MEVEDRLNEELSDEMMETARRASLARSLPCPGCTEQLNWRTTMAGDPWRRVAGKGVSKIAVLELDEAACARPRGSGGRSTFTSKRLAQDFEDAMLRRALRYIDRGRYIDIGARVPNVDSVSLAFYDLGGCGVHVEPIPAYAQAPRLFPTKRSLKASPSEIR
jgi:hypothetical protein